MKNLTMFLPESTYGSLVGLAKSAGVELSHFCSNVLTDFAAEKQRAEFSSNGSHFNSEEGVRSPREHLRPDKDISEIVLVKEIVAFLKNQRGSAEKATVEKAVFERNKTEFSKPYWQTLVGGGVPRWKKNTQFARNSACKLGLIKLPTESGRGIWELTEKGLRWNFE